MKQQAKNVSPWKLGALSALCALLVTVFACSEEPNNNIQEIGSQGNKIEGDAFTAIEAPKFLILIRNTDHGLKLTCEGGCAWKALSFSLNQDKSQAVDQFGMSSVNRSNPSKDDNLSNFLFNIKRTKTGITLEGKEGTAWTMLNFDCPDNKCNEYIDRNGMTTKD